MKMYNISDCLISTLHHKITYHAGQEWRFAEGRYILVKLPSLRKEKEDCEDAIRGRTVARLMDSANDERLRVRAPKVITHRSTLESKYHSRSKSLSILMEPVSMA